MKVKDLENYNFHDAGLLKIEKNETFVKLTILFLLYDQNNYKEGNPENSEITLTFNNISFCDFSEKEIHNDTIIDVEIIDNRCTFKMSDPNDEFYMFTIEAESVEFNTVRIIDDLNSFYEENNL